VGEHLSVTERRADEATRDVVNWLKCEYLMERVGEQYTGVVSAVTGFGLFVMLDDLYVEGLIHVTGLPKDYYHHEAAHHRMVGERTGRIFRLGQKLSVRLVRVNLEERKIDFELVEVGNEGAKPLGKRKNTKKTKASDKTNELATEHGKKEKGRRKSSNERGKQASVKKPQSKVKKAKVGSSENIYGKKSAKNKDRKNS